VRLLPLTLNAEVVKPVDIIIIGIIVVLLQSILLSNVLN